jgi:hypothetical protein
MSPVAADKLTCTTSVEVKIAYECVGVTDSSSRRTRLKTHLVWEDERKFYFVANFGIPTTAQGKRSWGTSGNAGDETERRHRWVGGSVVGTG